MTVCFSFRDDCWRVYLLWDFIWCATYRRVGPSFSSKDQANAYIAAVRRGETSLLDPTEANGVDHG